MCVSKLCMIFLFYAYRLTEMEILYKKEKEEADQLLEQQRLVSSSDFLQFNWNWIKPIGEQHAAQRCPKLPVNLSRAPKSWFDRSPDFRLTILTLL